MNKKYMLAGLIAMIISMIFFIIGFTGAVWNKASGIPVGFIVLIVIAIAILAAASVLVFIGITRGNYLEDDSSQEDN